MIEPTFSEAAGCTRENSSRRNSFTVVFVEFLLKYFSRIIGLSKILRTPFNRGPFGGKYMMVKGKYNQFWRAVYKPRDENGEWNAGNLGNVIFRGMSSNIPGNIAKCSGECY